MCPKGEEYSMTRYISDDTDDPEPVFVREDPYGLLVTLEDPPNGRAFVVRPYGDHRAKITLEGRERDEEIADFDNEDQAQDAYTEAIRATTMNDAIMAIKRERRRQENET